MRKTTWSVWTAVLLMWAAQSSAGQRPVSIGINANWELSLARSANAGWVRMDFVWSNLEPQRGQFNWSEAEAHVTEAEANGLQILAILHYVPAWANGGGCQSTPPLTTVDWANFVKQLAIKYSGRIAAYEIWNEPDVAPGDCGGIGWNRNVEEPPLLTDFVHTAAQQIRTYSPGSLVVGLGYRSRNDGYNSQADNRKRRFFQQMNAAVYADGPGPSFLDVTSFHNNARTNEASSDMAYILRGENLNYLAYIPSKASAPVWVTEYGWKTNYVGNNGQREKICNVTKYYTGIVGGMFGLSDYNITRSFIYALKDGTSASIFNGDNSPKPVVTQYLQRLAFPATQQPTNSSGYPNCNGSLSLQPEIRLSDVVPEWNVHGLRDPREGLPLGFVVRHGERSEDGRGVYLVYEGGDGTIVTISTRPAEPDDDRFISDSAAEWTKGGTHISVRQLSGPEQDKGWARALAATIDPDLSKACVEDRLLADDAAVLGLGFRAPKAPKGFVAWERRLDLTRMSGGCGSTQAATSKDFDFFWSFIGASGEIVRAGIYRYGDGFKGEVINPSSLHWSDADGTRYWVAADVMEMTPALEDTLYAVARSMDPSFVREPRTRAAGRVR
jgi:hypothetical protein